MENDDLRVVVIRNGNVIFKRTSLDIPGLREGDLIMYSVYRNGKYIQHHKVHGFDESSQSSLMSDSINELVTISKDTYPDISRYLNGN